jgi:hypothetical protein
MPPTAQKQNGQEKEIFHKLVNEALSIVLAAGVPGSAFQVRVDLWVALRQVFARERRRRRLHLAAGNPLRLDSRLIARLAEAAYRAALGHSMQQPFVDVELAIWDRFHAVAKNLPPTP